MLVDNLERTDSYRIRYQVLHENRHGSNWSATSTGTFYWCPHIVYKIRIPKTVLLIWDRWTRRSVEKNDQIILSIKIKLFCSSYFKNLNYFHTKKNCSNKNRNFVYWFFLTLIGIVEPMKNPHDWAEIVASKHINVKNMNRWIWPGTKFPVKK